MVLIAPRADDAVRQRDEILTLLRSGSGDRPRFDPDLAGGLRAWLEDAASLVVAARGEDAPPLVLGTDRLGGGGPDAPARAGGPDAVLATLVHVAFRQIVTTGSVDDPLGDALSALSIDPWRRELVEHLRGLSELSRAALRRTLKTHVDRLLELTPRFAPGWLPRTDDRVAIPLAGGRVVLRGTFDLLVGVPEPGTASLCAIGVTAGGPLQSAQRAMRVLALLETLRNGMPPFRLALLESAGGHYGVEDVTEEHLRSTTALVAQRLEERAGAGV
jgi:hypothetical protein